MHWTMVQSQLYLDGKSLATCDVALVSEIIVTHVQCYMQVLCIAGNCHKIDVCANFNYKAFSLTLA